MNYFNTFIRVAADSKAISGTAPKPRGEAKTVAQLEYEFVVSQPYVHTQEDVQFYVHAQRTGLRPTELKRSEAKLREEFFSKPMACMRTSALAKTYGWGLHFNSKGQVALVSVGTPEYEMFANDNSIEHTRAMSSKRV
jgi:Family of unknown function (DUF6157)